MWGIVNAWVALDPTVRFIEFRMLGSQFAVRVIDGCETEIEPVREDEDPSVAIVRAFQRLPVSGPIP